MTLRRALFALLLSVVPATFAHAQVKRPIAPYVFDIRAFYSPLGQDPTTASNLDLLVTDLPSRGLGGVAGLHLYPLRRKTFAFGIGAEYLLARGRKVPEPDDSTTPPTKPIVEQRLMSFTPQLSLNFGHREGWSYLTAGTGPMTFETFTGTIAPLEKPLRKNTINMGGGARWFATPHVAFTFDVRYYLTRPIEETPSHPGRQRNRIRVLSAGISIR